MLVAAGADAEIWANRFGGVVAVADKCPVSFSQPTCLQSGFPCGGWKATRVHAMHGAIPHGDLSHVSPVSGEFDSIEGGGNSKTGGSKLGSAGPDDVQHF